MGNPRKELRAAFDRMHRSIYYRICLYLLGVLSLPIVLLVYAARRKNNAYMQIVRDCKKSLYDEGLYDVLLERAHTQTERKQVYFGLKRSPKKDSGNEKKIAAEMFCEELGRRSATEAGKRGVKNVTFSDVFSELMGKNWFFALTLLISPLMYALLVIYRYRMSKYIFERLLMMIFVVFGVTFLVFTILYFSPMQPARNLLGEAATEEQIANFNAIYGLDKPYLTRLFKTFQNLVTFDLGKSYQGGEDVARALILKFPTTFELTIWSLLVALIIAIPAGIISAIKQYTSLDHMFMFLALLGLSIPNFWLGLILILTFSINLGWLPATFVAGQSISFLMPAIVLGTGMSASVARMTRSSMLEVKKSDYVLTARAKGLSERKVIFNHILRNALIPIVTVVGLQFGGLLGGASVVEKVFNINGLGSYIVDKQFVPDIPIVLAGVVYIAVVISIANLLVDILYSFLDPRIKN